MPSPTDVGGAPSVAALRCATTSSAVRTTPSGPGSVASRTCARTRPSLVDEHAERLRGADVEADRPASTLSPVPPCLPAARRSPPPRRAVTSPAPRWSAASSVRRPGQPHSTTTVPEPAAASVAGRRAAGARRAPGAPAARPEGSVDPGATTSSAGSPQGAAPIAMVPAESTRTTRAPASGGRVPDTVTDRAAPSASQIVCGSIAGSTVAPQTNRGGRRLRSPPRPGAPRRSRPARTASTSAAWIDRTCSTELSAPMQSRSAPAAIESTAASGMPRAADAPAMSRASLTITPREAEPVAQQPEHRRAQRRRQRRVQRGHHDVRGHHRRRTGLDRGHERHQLPRGQHRQVDIQHRQREVAVLGGVAVAREVLGAGGDPRRLQPEGPRGHVRRHLGRRWTRSSGCRSPGCRRWSSRRRPGRGRG